MPSVDDVALPDRLTLHELRRSLRGAGAAFAFLHGSRVRGTPTVGSDLDVAAWFGRPLGSWEVTLPSRCDLLILDTAGLELAGRVAQYGVLVVDDDPPARVAWQADRTKRFLDEAHRRRDLVATLLGRG